MRVTELYIKKASTYAPYVAEHGTDLWHQINRMTRIKSDFAFSTGKVLINSNGVCFKSLGCTPFCKGL